MMHNQDIFGSHGTHPLSYMIHRCSDLAFKNAPQHILLNDMFPISLHFSETIQESE